MKQLLIVALAFTLAASVSQAQQSASANSQAGSLSSAGASAGSQSGSQINQTFESGGASTSTVSGTTTLRMAPDAIAPSLGSGHPCMINTSVGFSVIGGGASGGSGKVDVGCMMMRSGAKVDQMAGRYYYAAQDDAACRAWRSAGALAKGQLCGDDEAAATSSKSPTARPALFNKCYLKSNGHIGIKYTSQGRANKSMAQTACANSLK